MRAWIFRDVSVYLPKPLENVATECTICCAAANLFLKCAVSGFCGKAVVVALLACKNSNAFDYLWSIFLAHWTNYVKVQFEVGLSGHKSQILTFGRAFNKFVSRGHKDFYIMNHYSMKPFILFIYSGFNLPAENQNEITLDWRIFFL